MSTSTRDEILNNLASLEREKIDHIKEVIDKQLSQHLDNLLHNLSHFNGKFSFTDKGFPIDDYYLNTALNEFGLELYKKEDGIITVTVSLKNVDHETIIQGILKTFDLALGEKRQARSKELVNACFDVLNTLKNNSFEYEVKDRENGNYILYVKSPLQVECEFDESFLNDFFKEQGITFLAAQPLGSDGSKFVLCI